MLSADAPSRGAPRLAGTGGMLRTGVLRHFDVTLRFATPDIRLASVDASRWWAADARVERVCARPNRVVVVKTALTCVVRPTVVRFWDDVESWRRIIW